MLTESITAEEIKWALGEASENSASGPSGQSLSFFKYLFMEAPALMTAAVN